MVNKERREEERSKNGKSILPQPIHQVQSEMKKEDEKDLTNHKNQKVKSQQKQVLN